MSYKCDVCEKEVKLQRYALCVCPECSNKYDDALKLLRKLVDADKILSDDSQGRHADPPAQGYRDCWCGDCKKMCKLMDQAAAIFVR